MDTTTICIGRSGHWGTGPQLLGSTSSSDLRAGLEAQSLTASRGSLPGAPPKAQAVSTSVVSRKENTCPRAAPWTWTHRHLSIWDRTGNEKQEQKETCISPRRALGAHTGFHTPPARALPATQEVRQRPVRYCVLGGPRRRPGEQAPDHQPSGPGDHSVPVIHTPSGPGQGGVTAGRC